MNNKNIEPSKITKPIQLLAAWLAGLVLVNASFLATASNITTPSWAPGLLVIASVTNVPLFLVAIFLLQTKFRPEMQEDEFYSKYLHQRYSAETDKQELVLTPTNEPISIKRESHTRVMINDLLPKYKDIRSVLHKSGINIDSEFGSTSVHKEIPPHLLLTIGRNVDIKLFQNVVNAIDSHIDYISIIPKEWDANVIYIGSYAYREENISHGIEFNKELKKKLLSPTITNDELIDILD